MAKEKRERSGPRDLRPWQVAAVLAGAVLFFFRDILFLNAFFWEDFLYQYYAFRSFAAVTLAGGELPLWNPYTFNGMPFQADIQSAIFYLPNLMLTALASGGKLHFWWVEFLMVLHIVLAGGGMYLLARSYGLGRWYALFAGVAYCFSGFLIGHVIHQGFLYHAAWFPLIVLTFRNAMSGRSLTAMIVSGLLLGLAILSGAPQITLYIVLFLFFLFVYEAFVAAGRDGWNGTAGRAGIAAGVIAVALLVTAVQLLPTFELAPYSQRAEITYEKAAEGSLTYSQLVTFLSPRYFGSSGAGGSDYSGPGAYWNYWETAGYFGAPAFLLAVVALLFVRKKPPVLFLGFTMLFGLFFALGDNFFLHRLFHDHVPGFGTFRVPGRMLIYLAFGGPILAAIGLRHVVEGFSGARTDSKKIAYLFVAAGALVWLLGQTGALVDTPAGAGSADFLAVTAAESMKSAIMLLVLGGILFLAARRSFSAALIPAAFLVAQFADTYIAGFGQNNGKTDPEQYYARTAQLVDLVREEGKTELFRVNSRQGGAMILDRNQGMVDRIFLMEGYTPLVLSRYIPPLSDWDRIADLMNAKYRIAPDGAGRSLSVRRAGGYAPRAFMVHNGVVAASEDEARTILSSPDFDYRSTAVFEEEPPVLHGDTGSHPSRVTFDGYRLNEISLTVETEKEGYLVLSEIFYPGWTATVDGEPVPVLRADWCLRAVPLTAGTHSVVMEFSPSSFRVGAWISALALSGALAALVYIRRKVPGTERGAQTEKE